MMQKRTIIWLGLAVGFILVGCIVLGSMIPMLRGDISKLSTTSFETNSYEIDQAFQNISIATITADIVFTPSEDTKTSVICYEEASVKHAVNTENGTLSVTAVDTRQWYDYIGIHFHTPKITVALPQEIYGKLSIHSDTGDAYIADAFQFDSIEIFESTGNVSNYASASGSIQIKTSTGSIRVQNVSAGTMELSTSTGCVTISNVTATENINIKTSTGDTFTADVQCLSMYEKGTTGESLLKNVIATEKLSVERTTGDIEFDRCDGGEIFLKTSTGDIEGTLLTEKVFIASSNTGDVHIPKTTSGGKCEISTSTGDIEVKIA